MHPATFHRAEGFAPPSCPRGRRAAPEATAPRAPHSECRAFASGQAITQVFEVGTISPTNGRSGSEFDGEFTGSLGTEHASPLHMDTLLKDVAYACRTL